MSTQEATFASLLGVSTIYHLVAMGLLIKRRSVFPVSGREVILVLGFAVGTLASDVQLCLEGLLPNISCRLALFTSVYTALLALNSLCARLFRLWFLYFLAQERLKNYYHKSEGQSTWFAERRLWTTPKYLVGFFLMVSVVEAVILELVFMLLPDSDDCESLEMVSIGVYALEVLTIICVIVTAYRIRNVQDGYLIQREIYLLMYAGIAYIPFVFLHSNPEHTDTQFPVSNLMLILIGMVFTAITIYYPVYKSYYPTSKKGKRRPSQVSRPSRELSSDVPSLMAILTRSEHEKFAKDFEEHLTKEFAVESILFFRSAHAFESLEAENLSDVALAGRAMRVWLTFIDEKSDNWINISHELRAAIYDHLSSKIPNFDMLVANSSAEGLQTNGRIDLNVFLAAKNNIYTLMNTDTYRRWSGKYVVRSRRGTVDNTEKLRSASSMHNIVAKPITAAIDKNVDSSGDEASSSSTGDETMKVTMSPPSDRSSVPSIEANAFTIPSQIV